MRDFQVADVFGEGVYSIFLPDAQAAAAIRSHPEVEAAGSFLPAWKLDPVLPTSSPKPIPVVLALVAGQEATTVQALKNLGVYVGPAELLPEGVVEAVATTAQLTALAQLPGVRSVGPASERIPLNRDERGYSGAASLELPVAAGGKGLDGSGMVVGIGDNCPALGHVDTRDRNLNFNPARITNHATHVAGIVGGTGLLDPRARGMAPQATLLTHFFDAVWAKTPELLQGYGMTLTNNSYAAQVGNCNYAGTYDAYSAALDKLAADFPTVLHVFASGNDGGSTCAPYATGYATVPGGYQPAKNNLVVGNVAKNLTIWTTSSRGPVKDGRLKPEICAFGTDVYSCKPINTYQLATGTSMACPAVTGALTLLSQRYKSLNNGANAPGLLLKSLLVNGADDLGREGPDHLYGFGMFNLSKAIAALEAGRYQAGTAAAGSSQALTVSVPSGAAQLKVLLSWNDVPASATASKALVNDLDLTVTTPNGTVRRPLILDPAAPDAVAVEGADHLNNTEQVVINTPAAGTYTVTVAGYSVSGSGQPYIVAYDFVSDGVRLLQPTGGVPVPAGSPVNVYWEASPGSTPFTLEASADNGATWSAVATAAANERSAVWNVPATAASNARFRVVRGAQATASGPFAINAIPQLQLAAQQCPGYVVVDWNTVSGATAYELLRKIGPDLKPVDTVTGTTYAFGGLPLYEEQYVAVRPLIGGVGGYRSNAVVRVPSSGTGCGAFANGDLRLDSVLTPTTGREATGSSLTASQPLLVRVRNLGSTAVGSYTVAYRLSTGAWSTSAVQPSLAAGSSATVSLGTANLAAPGSYPFQAAVLNTTGTDPVRANDSIAVVFRQLPNAPVALIPGVSEKFETAGRLVVQKDTAGLFGDARWDYGFSGSPYGRLRTFVDSTITIAGTQSLSLDADRSNDSTANHLTGTFNLAGISLATAEIRLEWDYRLHGVPKMPSGNNVWVRGSDVQPWIALAGIDTAAADGQVRSSGSLSVSDALIGAGQTLSSSFGVQFNQTDTSVIAARDFGNGLTLDNIHLYSVLNDVAVVSIDTPIAAACNLAQPIPLRVRLANGTRVAQSAVPVFYRLDSNAVQSAVLPSLAAKDTVLFTFPQLLNASAPGLHRLDVWVAQPGDSYLKNDSLLRYEFRNQPLVDSFPYLQTFEASDGFWFADGRNSSWAWGTPAGARIRSAASGTKAWKTGLTRGYNDNERSYLYSPCFDVSRLAAPMLSFSQAYEMENCGSTLCDAAWLEWSTDGAAWTKLGAAGDGFHWYDSAAYNAWTTQDGIRWKTATIALPQVTAPLRLRFVLESDAGTVKEGLALDDVHVYDRGLPPFSGDNTTVSVASVPGVPVAFEGGGEVLATLQPLGQSLGATSVSAYRHLSLVDSFTQRYLLPRSFVVKSASAPADSVFLQLYVTDDDVVRMLQDSTCPSCSKAPDVYRLGVLKYDDANEDLENETMRDNRNGLYRFRKAVDVAWVPYDRGYYARFPVRGFSEFWFTDDGPENPFPPAETAVLFNARRRDRTTVQLDWQSFIDSSVQQYEVQRSVNGQAAFQTIANLPARNQTSSTAYTAEDQPGVASGDSVFYRLKWRQLDGTTFYSGVRRVVWSEENTALVYPNPTANGRVIVRYTANPGSVLRARLTDLFGRTVLQTESTATAWENLLTLDQPQARGLLILQLELGGNRFTEKILFQ